MFRVRIPAGTTNLGAGFDCLGLALSLHNILEIEPCDALRIDLQEQDAGRIPDNEQNLVWQAMRRAFEAGGCPCRPVRIRPVNRIPIARGLGSSAACIVGGIEAADHIMGGKLSLRQKLALGAAMDGHPDNIAPAFLGGLTAAVVDGDEIRTARAMPHPDFMFFIMIPGYELPTRRAREALPGAYSRAVAVHSLGRSTLMFASLAMGLPENLWAACDDRMHQPYRKALVPGFDRILEAAREYGAAGAWLSGAGPSVAAALWGGAAGFEAKMRDALADLPGGWKIEPLRAEKDGVTVEP